MRVQYDRASLRSTKNAAFKIARSSGQPMYIFGTASGFTIQPDPPPFKQIYMQIKPTGEVHSYHPDFGWEKSKSLALGERSEMSKKIRRYAAYVITKNPETGDKITLLVFPRTKKSSLFFTVEDALRKLESLRFATDAIGYVKDRQSDFVTSILL